MRKTSSTDWFTKQISNCGWLVSGTPSFARALGLYDHHNVALRYFGNSRKLYLIALTVGAPQKEWGEIRKILDLQRKKTKENVLSSTILNRNRIILYPDMIASTEPQSPIFLISDQVRNWKPVSSKGLESWFKKINPNLTKDRGDIKKRINKSVNDAFQIWTRQYLSRYIVVNDIDALWPYSRKPILLELKRVQEDIKTWRPYVDDYSNFSTLEHVAKALNADWYVVSYNRKNPGPIALHKVIEATPEFIKGKRIEISSEPYNLLLSLFSNKCEVMGVKYLSPNKRQPDY